MPRVLEISGNALIRCGHARALSKKRPFGSADRRSRFEPQRVALENAKDGKVLEELLQPRTSFQGQTLETPWSDLQLAYFVGCAMWTYLNTPFLLVRPGVESEEICPQLAA